MKRIIFPFLCAAAIATQFFTPKAVTAEDNTFDCFTYEIQSDHVKLTSFTIPARRVDYIIIPSVISDLPVTEIAEGVFYDLKSFLYVYWPETLTVIPSYTFGGNNSTIELYFPIHWKRSRITLFRMGFRMFSIQDRPKNGIR